MKKPENRTLYRLDWGLGGKAYELSEHKSIWVERLDFSNKECIYTEDYQQITYAKYLRFCLNDQIVDDYTKDVPTSFVKAHAIASRQN